MKKYRIIDLQGGELYKDEVRTLNEWREEFIKLEEQRVFSFGIPDTIVNIIKHKSADEVFEYIENLYEIKFVEVV